MKSCYTILLLLLSASLLWHCTTTEQSHEAQWNEYATAMSHGDILTAITTVNSIYASDTSNQSTLDTLMRLYFIRGNHLSAYQTGNKLRDKGTVQKSILAESAINIGKADEALLLFEDIDKTDSVGLTLNARYKLASLYFNEEAYPKALEALGQIVQDPESMNLTTRIAGDNEVAQQVKLYAASHNFAGYVFLLLNEFDTAEGHFNEALRVEPEFRLAQNNKNQLAEKRLAAQ